MKDFEFNIGSPSTRRRIATIIAVIGVAFVASRLASVWPRDTHVTYEVGPGIAELDVDYLQEDEAVASVRFAGATQGEPFFRHTVRLQPGEYQIHITLYGHDGSAVEEARSLAVPARGANRFDLKDATEASE
jgi:hypothetical protein